MDFLFHSTEDKWEAGQSKLIDEHDCLVSDRTDTEDFKCSWLVIKALELSSQEQKKVLCARAQFSLTIVIVSSSILRLICSFIMFGFRRTMGNQTQPMSQTERPSTKGLIFMFELDLSKSCN
jgi:hypothetical protein